MGRKIGTPPSLRELRRDAPAPAALQQKLPRKGVSDLRLIFRHTSLRLRAAEKAILFLWLAIVASLGNLSALVDAAGGGVTARYAYAAFGNTLSLTS